MDLGDLEARLDGELERLGEINHVAAIDGECAIQSPPALVQLSGELQCLTTQVCAVRLRGNALVLLCGT